MRSALGCFIFATCVDENDSDEPEYSTWLLLVVSEKRFQSIRSGGISMLDAYREANAGTIWKMDFEENSSKSAKPVLYTEIPERFLPSDNSFLAIPTDTANKFDADAISNEANAIQKNMFVIELFPEEETRTELPLYELSTFAHETQAVVDSILAEKREGTSDKGKLPQSIRAEAELKAKYILAASFALVTVEGAEGSPDVSQLPEVVNEFGELLRSTSEGETFLDELDRHTRRTKSRFMDYARSLSDSRCGLTVHSFNASGGRSSLHADLSSIRSAIDVFDQVEPSKETITIEEGGLVASDTRSWRFVIHDRQSNQQYSGKVSAAARPKLDGLSVGQNTHVSAVIEIEYLNQFSEEDPDRKYTLLDIAEEKAHITSTAMAKEAISHPNTE